MEVGAYSFDAVQRFKYLGVIFTYMWRDCINGNKTYYAQLGLFKSRLLTKIPKLTMYKTLIRSILPYRCEDWTLMATDYAQIAYTESTILWKMFGFITRYNSELNDLIQSKTVVLEIC